VSHCTQAQHRPARTRPLSPLVNVVFVVLPDTLLLDLAGPAEAFRLANQHRQQQGLAPAYALHFVGPQPEAACSVGLQVSGLCALPEVLVEPSWVMLLGRPGSADQVIHHPAAWWATRQWLGRVLAPALQDPQSHHRLLTVCSGALLAADAGLLAGRAVTTHHELLADLARLAPSARVLANRVFVEDGPVLSSAGITAGIDLALHQIAQTLGEGVASAVAQVMVVFHRRGRDDPQQSPLLAGRRHLHPGVHAVQNAVLEAPGEDWSMDRLAALAHVTPRHLTRLFQEHAGLSPREHVEQVRLSLAREARQAGLSVQQAVALAGFSSERQWRRAQARHAAAPGPADPAPAVPRP
jgi:transcriptional regulator GlxA family with amidase domain